ncbi:MAG: hypothetical protein EBQ92_12825 [Proteobacteria bacterium]|nr:hypothetical protein [Pseudomonadota bacterium]
MSDSKNPKFPKVGVFLVVISVSGKWLFDVRRGTPRLPFKELAGGESWEGALGLVKKTVAVEIKSHSLTGIGTGEGQNQENWVYCAFKSEGIKEVLLEGYQWLAPETCNTLEGLDLKIKQAFYVSPNHFWAD